MPASLIIDMNAAPLDGSVTELAAKAANASGRLLVSAASGNNWTAHASYGDKCLLGKDRIYENDKYIGCYAGALIDQSTIPWPEIIDGLENGRDAVFNTLEACHAIIVYSKPEHTAYLVTDKFGQYSLYAGFFDGQLLVSTTLHTFIHVLENPKVDPAWLHDFFLYNYPLASTTQIRGVERIGPGLIVKFDLRSGKREERRYAPQLKKKETSLSMREAQALALDIFNKRFPSYYDNISPGGCGVGVTGGFDARIVASYMPERTKSQLYTYGNKGCSDMVNGRLVAERLGLEHHAFPFDDMSSSKLRELARDTVFYSGGTLNALRATLAMVYRHLTGAGLGIILTGVSSGHFFRGVFSSPQVLSAATVKLIRNPDWQPDGFYDTIFNDSQALRESFRAKQIYLKEELGWNDMAVEERHMSFMHYEQAPKYFGGELAFAESFGHMRSPFWDGQIRALSYEIPLSTLHNSLFLDRPALPWESKAMLGYILAHGRLKHLNVDGMPPKYWASGNKFGYYTGKILHKGPAKLAGRLFGRRASKVPLEDWGTWVKNAFVPQLESGFEKTPLAQYIQPAFVHEILKGNAAETMTMHWIGKLITASLVIDLVEKRY